jgi:hypothetical protein
MSEKEVVDVFGVVGAATKRRNGYPETKDELDTALGKAHADAHVLAELECSRLPYPSKSQYMRTKRVGPPTRDTKFIALIVEDEFKCMDKCMKENAYSSGDSGAGGAKAARH